MQNVYTGNYAYGQRGATYNPTTGVSARGGSATVRQCVYGPTADRPRGASDRARRAQTTGAARVGDKAPYADHNGNMYRNTGSGWANYDNGSWNSVQDDDKCSRSRPSSRHDSGEISALRPLPGAHETGAVGLAGPALMREVLAVASVAVAGTVVVAASGAVAGAGAAGGLVGLGDSVAVGASGAAGKAGRLLAPASVMVGLGPCWQHGNVLLRVTP